MIDVATWVGENSTIYNLESNKVDKLYSSLGRNWTFQTSKNEDITDEI